MSLFGPLAPSLIVEQAATATLRKWMRTYLAEVEAQFQVTRGSLALPQSYPTASQFGRLEDQLPAVCVFCPGTTGPTVKEPSGLHRVTWVLEVGALVSASDHVNTDHLAKLYAAAIWGSIMQRPSLGDVAEHVQMADDGEKYDVIDATSDRTLAFCQLTFDVVLRDARSGYGGPSVPLPPDQQGDDHGDWPTVETVDIEIEAVGIDDDLDDPGE